MGYGILFLVVQVEKGRESSAFPGVALLSCPAVECVVR